jgi:hypothetical protein
VSWPFCFCWEDLKADGLENVELEGRQGNGLVERMLRLLEVEKLVSSNEEEGKGAR